MPGLEVLLGYEVVRHAHRRPSAHGRPSAILSSRITPSAPAAACVL